MIITTIILILITTHNNTNFPNGSTSESNLRPRLEIPEAFATAAVYGPQQLHGLGDHVANPWQGLRFEQTIRAMQLGA